jgi:hypothetical protein
MMTNMPIGETNVFELRPLTGLLFIPQEIYEHGEPWWNGVDRGKVIRLPELSGNPTSRVIWQQAGRTGEGNDKFGLAKYFCSYLQVTFYMPQNLTT